ncbi:MAG TPA: hypothetical protein VMD74_00900 [Candidatus Methylomirabilis sp.]|nr:hypothetical protein [Candidatus Methylomirabilis sp.]
MFRKVSSLGVINHTDFFFPFPIKKSFWDIFNSWSPNLFGSDSTSVFSTIINGFLIYGVQLIFGINLGSRILYLAPLVFIFLSSYLLIGYLLRESKYKDVAVFLGAFFSICNLAVFNDMILGTYNILFGLAFIIFAFYLLVKGLEEKKIIYAVYLGISSLLFFHQTSLALFVLFVFLFIIFSALFKKNVPLKFSFKFILLALSIGIFLNGYWIAPYATKIFSGNFIEETFAGGRDTSILVSSSDFSKLQSMVRLIPYYDPQKMFVFNGPWEIAVGFIFIFIILLPFFRKKVDFYPFFFFSTALIFLILSLGDNAVFGGLFNFLWNHFSLFHGFRSTRRFLHLVVISYTVLLSFAVVYLNELTGKLSVYRKYFKNLLNISIFLLISFISWPFFSGNLLGAVLPLQLPDSYLSLEKSLEQDKLYSSVFVLPNGNYPFYTWMQAKSQRKLYSNFDEKMIDYVFELNFYPKPVINLFAYSYQPLIAQLYSLSDIKLSAFQKVLSFFNVKDILVHKDYYVDANSGPLNFLPYLNFFDASTLKLEENSFFSFYALPTSDILPKIYAPLYVEMLVNKKVDTGFFSILASTLEKNINIAFTSDPNAARSLKNLNYIYPIMFDSFDKVKILKGEVETEINVPKEGEYTIEEVGGVKSYRISYRFKKNELQLLFQRDGSSIDINNTLIGRNSNLSREIDVALEANYPIILQIGQENYYLNSLFSDWQTISGGLIDVNINDGLTLYKSETTPDNYRLLNSANNYSLSLNDCSGQKGGEFSWKLLDKEKREFSIESDKGDACFNLNVGQLDKQKIYALSFSYSVVNGGVPSLCASDPNLNKCISTMPLDLNLPGKWIDYHAFFSGDRGYTIFPYFYHTPSVDKAGLNSPIKVLYQDVKMESFVYYTKVDLGDNFDNGLSGDIGSEVIDLTEGTNTVRFLSSEIDAQNLIPDGDFEGNGNIEDLWGPLHICSAIKEKNPDFYLKKVTDSFEGNKALMIVSKSQDACIAPAVKVDPGFKYLFSFDYKILSGSRPNINLNLNGAGLPFADFPDLNQLVKNKWYHYETLVDSPSRPSTLYIYFYNSPLNGIETKIIYDNVKFEKIPAFFPNSFFFKPVENNRNILPAAINISKINNSKYRADIIGASESFPLIFSESFHPSWKVYVKNDLADIDKNIIFSAQNEGSRETINQIQSSSTDASTAERMSYLKQGLLSKNGTGYISRDLYGVIQNENISRGKMWDTWFNWPVKKYFQIPETQHFEVNGFANAWYIDLDKLEKEGVIKKNGQGLYDFEIIIEYFPQRLFVVASIISGLAFLAILIFIIGYKSRKVR